MPPRKETVDQSEGDRASKRRAVDSTVIKVLDGSITHEITRSEVDRHPDSLLHSLVTSTETADDGAPAEVDLPTMLSAGQLSEFTYATAVVVALYR